MGLIDLVFLGLTVWWLVFARRVARLVSGPVWFDVARELYCAESVEEFELARRRFEAARFDSR